MCASASGAIYPSVTTRRGWVRLRILNGSNARSYDLIASDHRELHVIGSDSGLLAAPVSLEELTVLPGERFEVMVSTHDGQAFDLVTLPVRQMGMDGPGFDQPKALLTVQPGKTRGEGNLPQELVAVPAVDPGLAEGVLHLSVAMAEGLDSLGMYTLMMRRKSRPMTMDAPKKAFTPEQLAVANHMNGKAFDMQQIDFDMPLHKYQRWVFDEGTDRMMHPMHVHGCRFRVLAMAGKPPPEHLSGWKDTVELAASARSEILVRFDHPAAAATPYMTHCHILEHEDTGMMAQFTVT